MSETLRHLDLGSWGLHHIYFPWWTSTEFLPVSNPFQSMETRLNRLPWVHLGWANSIEVASGYSMKWFTDVHPVFSSQHQCRHIKPPGSGHASYIQTALHSGDNTSAHGLVSAMGEPSQSCLEDVSAGQNADAASTSQLPQWVPH